ncbi:hypothetical protein I4F81_004553 [Pyropia yezoensis]|uniref:Uncharacterized protein n=1 Tax=Pyropia yezoensis TaxID=2788 RepID=A0ACC3BVN3_PYRYE|nr:hypothetical protein I4F81_004553 [Neopyropia yezoensis]
MLVSLAGTALDAGLLGEAPYGRPSAGAVADAAAAVDAQLIVFSGDTPPTAAAVRAGMVRPPPRRGNQFVSSDASVRNESSPIALALELVASAAEGVGVTLPDSCPRVLYSTSGRPRNTLARCKRGCGQQWRPTAAVSTPLRPTWRSPPPAPTPPWTCWAPSAGGSGGLRRCRRGQRVLHDLLQSCRGLLPALRGRRTTDLCDRLCRRL